MLIGQTHQRHARAGDAAHRRQAQWQVEAVDQRRPDLAQPRAHAEDRLHAPTLRVSVSGKRVAGQALKIAVTATDTGGSGMDHITVDYGDRSKTSSAATTRHRYRRGTFTLKVAAVDKAGNVTRKQVRLRIKKS